MPNKYRGMDPKNYFDYYEIIGYKIVSYGPQTSKVTEWNRLGMFNGRKIKNKSDLGEFVMVRLTSFTWFGQGYLVAPSDFRFLQFREFRIYEQDYKTMIDFVSIDATERTSEMYLLWNLTQTYDGFKSSNIAIVTELF